MKLKKKISLLLAAVMTTSIANVPFASADETTENTTPVWKTMRTLSGETEVPSTFTATSGKGASLSLETDSNPTYNEYVNLKLGVEGAGWVDFICDFDDFDCSDEGRPNDTIELELDFKADQLLTNNYSYYQFRFMGKSYHYPITVNKNGTINLKTTGGNDVGTLGKMPSTWKWDDAIEWARYKFVFTPVRYTIGEDTTNTYKGYKLTDMFVDGVSVLNKELDAYSSAKGESQFIWSARNKDNTYAAADCTRGVYLNLPFGGKTASERNIGIDNITMVSYNSAVSTIPDRGTYLSDLRSAYAVYNEKAAASASAAPMIKLLDTINSGMTLFENKAATQEQFNAKKAELDACIENLKYLPNQLWFDDFSEDTTADYTLAAGIPSLTIDNTTFADDITLGNVIKMTRGSKVATEEDKTASSNYPRFSLDKVTIPIGGDEIAATNGNNSFAEVEFDIRIDKNMLEGSTKTYNTAIFFKDTAKSANVFSLLLSGNGTMSYGYDDNTYEVQTSINNFTFDFNKTHRIKFVMQTTDENGNATQKMTGIYLDGENMLPEPVKFTNISSKSIMVGEEKTYPAVESTCINRIYFSPNKIENADDYALYVDNLRINQYNLENAANPSPVKDLSSLVLELRRKTEEGALIDTYPARYAVVEAEYDAVVADLKEVYTNQATSTDAQIAEVVAKSKAVTEKLDKCNSVILFDDDFEASASINGTVVADGSYAIGNALELTTSTEAQLSEGTDLFTTEYGENTIIVTEFDVKTEDFNANENAVLNVKLQDSDGTDASIIKIDTDSFNMISKKDGTYRRYNELKDGKWYTVRLVTRVTGDDGAAYGKNTKLYIDGNNLVSLSTTDFGRELLISEGTYDKLAFEISNGKAYIDNVKVSRCYGLDYEPVNYGQLITSIRKGIDKVNDSENHVVTDEILNTFNNALNTAKSVYENKASLADVEVANDTLCKAYADFKFKNESVKIGSVNFANADGTEAVYMTNGGKITGVNVTKLAEYNTNGDVIVAVYNENKTLASVQFVPKALADAEVDVRTTVETDITLPADVTGCTVKVMVFDSMASMMPLTDAYVPTDAECTIYVAGDSIVQDYASLSATQGNIWPREGWGRYVADYYVNTTKNNLAVSGYTTRSYIDNQKMKTVEENIKPGDYFVVSFMANDSTTTGVKRVDRYDFKNLLRYYSDIAEAHGAQVVYVTSPSYLSEANNGSFGGGYGNGYYPQLMRDVAAEVNAPLVDVYQKRIDLQNKKGYAYVESAMYLCNYTTLGANFDTEETPVGWDRLKANDTDKDKTHINDWGARKCASWIAEEMQNLDCGLRYRVDESTFYDFPTNLVTSETIASSAE